MFYLLSLSLLTLFYSFFNACYLPRRYRHLKKISILELLNYILKKKSLSETFNELYQPILNKQGYSVIWQPRVWNLIVTDYKIIKEVMLNTETFYKSPEKRVNYGDLYFKFFGGFNVVFSDEQEWKLHRKSVNPAFKKSWDINVFAKSGYELIDKIESRNQEPTIMQNMFQQLALDILGRSLFSYEFHALKNGDKNENLLNYNQTVKGVFNLIYFMFPILDFFASKLLTSRKLVHQNCDDFKNFLKKIINSKKEEIESGLVKDDIVTLMIKDSIKNGEDSLTNEEILNNLTIFFVAGHDTTANTFTSTLYFLAKYQDIQEKARKQILEVLGNSNEIKVPTNSQQKELDYLNCVIKESMRIATTSVPLKRYANKNATLSDGTEIKRGDMISLVLYLHHRNPEYFPEPEIFNPDRFKDPHSIQSTMWMPFGIGSRICVGLNFSLIEQRVILLMLLQKYFIHLGPSSKQWKTPKYNSTGFMYIDNADIVFIPRI
ncbi:cytochrome P450, partial [Neoconidiobolus thromboides FSU 785]